MGVPWNATTAISQCTKWLPLASARERGYGLTASTSGLTFSDYVHETKTHRLLFA
jgi:hypothetical protein